MICKCDGFNVLYVNARSLRDKTDQLEVILKSLKIQVQIIVISETWLKPGEEKFYNIPDYNACYVSRDKHGGGVGILIRKSLLFKITKEHNSELSMLTVSIVKHNLSITALYRPPNYDMRAFLEEFENFLESTTSSRNIILGDFNLDLLKNGNNVNNYREIYESYNYHFINEAMPTRMSSRPSLIDHVAANFTGDSKLVLIDHCLSDHRLQLLCLPKPSQSYGKPEKKYKVYQNLNYLTAQDKLTELIKDLDQYTDPVLLYEKLEEVFISCRYVQVKEVCEVAGKEWINQKIIALVKKRDYYFKRLRKHDTEYYKRKHKEYSVKVKKQVKFEKKRYYGAEFKKNLENERRTWNTVNRILHNRERTEQIIPTLKKNGTTLTHSVEISNAFNDFFVSVGPDLSKMIKHIPVNRFNGVKDSFFLTPVLPVEVENIISAMDRNKACGADNITIESVQRLKTECSIILVKIINLSFQSGTIPDKLKVARVKPLFKQGDYEVASNYRPVSVLPVLSRILEICVNTRLQSFLDKINFLYEGQYGFCKDRDTETAVIDLISDIQVRIDGGYVCSLVSLDLRKAFDTVDHDILLIRLEEAGIRGTPYLWFKNYLQNRRQFVNVNNASSNLQPIRCGVPQGSVLGPTLFLIYINSIGRLSLRGRVKLYADDTTLVYYGRSVEAIKSDISRDLSMISLWLGTHKLTANVEKSSYMFLGKKNLNNKCHDILFENQLLRNSSVISYVGLFIDSTLSWTAHVKHIRRKIAPFVGIMYKVGYLLTVKLRKQLYYAHIYSHLHYLASVWGTAANYILNSLRTLQNRAIKNVFRLPLRYPTKNLYNMSRFLNITQIYSYKIMLYIHHILNNNKKSIIKFINVQDIHNHHTRRRNDIYLPQVKTSLGLRSIYHRGVKLFNSLPVCIRNTGRQHVFKRELKKFVLYEL